jgi:hypothetical protein
VAVTSNAAGGNQFTTQTLLILRISEYSGISFGEFRQMGGLPTLLERLRFLL